MLYPCKNYQRAGASTPALFSYQPRVTVGILYSLWFNADVTLRGGGTAVLQKPLHQGNDKSRLSGG